MEKSLWKLKLKFANAGRRNELQSKEDRPPTGLGSLGGVRRRTARTRGFFSLFMGKFWVGEVHVIEP
jgi:hypothetical protein